MLTAVIPSTPICFEKFARHSAILFLVWALWLYFPLGMGVIHIFFCSAEGVVLESVAGEVVKSLETFGVACAVMTGAVFLEVGVVIG